MPCDPKFEWEARTMLRNIAKIEKVVKSVYSWFFWSSKNVSKMLFLGPACKDDYQLFLSGFHRADFRYPAPWCMSPRLVVKFNIKPHFSGIQSVYSIHCSSEVWPSERVFQYCSLELYWGFIVGRNSGHKLHRHWPHSRFSLTRRLSEWKVGTSAVHRLRSAASFALRPLKCHEASQFLSGRAQNTASCLIWNSYVN